MPPALRSRFPFDATALMMSKNAATETDGQRQTEATNTFNSLFSRPEVTDFTVTPVYTSVGGSKLTLNGTAIVHTNFLGVIGISQVDISAVSVSTWGNTRLRVALVLDNTGSMANDGKMDALKTASHNLLTQLHNAAVHPEDVYVSIVPFSKDVNFGPDNYGQSWLRWDLWDAVNGTCSNTSYHKQSSCVSHGKVWTPAAHSTWNGCVAEHLRRQRNLQHLRQQFAKLVQLRGHLQRLGLHEPDQLPECRNLQYLGTYYAKWLPKCARLLYSGLGLEESVPKPRRHLVGRRLDLDSG